jgi:hypothetical protein
MQHVEVLLLAHVRVQRSSKYAEFTLFSETACLPIFPNNPASPKVDPLHSQGEKYNANRDSELRPFRNCSRSET